MLTLAHERQAKRDAEMIAWFAARDDRLVAAFAEKYEAFAIEVAASLAAARPATFAAALWRAWWNSLAEHDVLWHGAAFFDSRTGFRVPPSEWLEPERAPDHRPRWWEHA